MQIELVLILLLGLLGSSWEQSTRSGYQINDAEIGSKVIKIMDSFRDNYDKRIRPNYGGPPVIVGISLYVISITSISEVNMDFTINLYLRQSWNDPRLKFKGPNGISTISVGASLLESLWQPDTFIVNEKESEYHLIPAPNEFVRISENGDVLRSSRLTLTASCPMTFETYPMDRQKCSLEFESYGYTKKDIRYEWGKGLRSIGISNEVSAPQFRVLGHRQRDLEISLTTGNYTRMSFEIEFARSLGHYILQTYVPSGLIVFLSWIPLFLDRSPIAILGRVALGTITVLAEVVIWTNSSSALPKISYLKAMDCYIAFCLASVIIGLLESVLVGSGSPKSRQQLGQKRHGSDDDQSSQNVDGKVLGIHTSTIDKCCRVLFPVGFVIFNSVYWISYLKASSGTGQDLILLDNSTPFTT